MNVEMIDSVFADIPDQYQDIVEETGKLFFNMNSDLFTGRIIIVVKK